MFSGTMLDKAKRFYRDHEPACTAGLFVAGFLFDTLAVGRIDRLHNVIHQAVYLGLCAWFIGLEIRELCGEFAPRPASSAPGSTRPASRTSCWAPCSTSTPCSTSRAPR
ncbi:MAG: hypothetical protein M0D55_07940 [Elusimicrobiota bacterium]|nr:MAG: hypothetical protein M0D55_07940 [Elusimicrobiota bacterium]